MRVKILLIALIAITLNLSAQQERNNYAVETKNTVMLFTGKTDGKFNFQYYGQKVDNVNQIVTSGIGSNTDAYPAFGIECTEEKALQVTHADGNLSVDLYLKGVKITKVDDNVTLITVSLYDNKYPFNVTLYYKAFYKEDVIEAWTEISHQEKSPIMLYKFASFAMPIRSFNAWVTHFHGNWADEMNMVEEKLERGMKVIKNREGIRNTQFDNPSIMISLNGKASENQGEVIAGTLVWTGNYSLKLDGNIKNQTNFIAGMNEDASNYLLEKNEVFKTPSFVLTYSNAGKGQASRNIIRWGRNYQIVDGNKERMILLNSWEGVYFNTQEDKMLAMIDDIAALGGELFVMDDGWFGNKYPRKDDKSSLGDWDVNKQKLPNGLKSLIDRAKEKNIKFGIWLEPEMVNVKSEVFEKHPDWVISQPNRTTVLGRGGSQMTLDLSNPKVQDFVYNTIHNLLVENPGIAYIKWDANHFISNVGSNYLPAIKQSHLYIETQRGLQKVLQRIRDAHPDLIMQACASGGGRVTYDFMKYFHEFWTSDNTDALTRLYMQWGISHFYPAMNMASHVSESPNHQTGRQLPLKFRFDVAMTGRLGIEMQPKRLTPDELEFSKVAIDNYKRIRPVIQFGDLYRLVSPYDNVGMAALMYVTETKNKAVLFGYNLDKNLRYKFPPLKLNGLDPAKKYKITEINKEILSSDGKSVKPGVASDNSIFTGEYLTKVGVQIIMQKAYQSVVVEITEVK